jgi:hypothetical protein
MADDDEKSVADEAKGFSQEVVATLGLVELILGGVAFYGIWLIFRNSGVGELFPSTGTFVVDIALQLFVAALVGKVIYLIVAFPMGLMRLIMKRLPTFYQPLEDALRKFYDAATVSKFKTGNTNLIDVAVMHLSLADAGQRVAFERRRLKIIVAFGTSILAGIFFFYLFHEKYIETPASLLIFLVIVFFVFIFIGFLEQRSLVSEAALALISLHRVEERKKELEQGHH